MKRANPILRSMFGRATGLFFSLIFFASIGCTAPTSGAESMEVELDIFSGRPNPRWDLTSQEAEEFANRFQSLPQHQGGSILEGLGYRGLIVTKVDENIGEYEEIQISNGLVVARRNSQSQQFVDQNRKLEEWLLQTGREQLDEALYEQVIQQLH